MQIDINGQGPPLVLVHSLLTDSQAFDHVLPRLAQRHRVIRVALPGFGETPPLSIDSPTVFDIADAVMEGIKSADAGPECAVLGNGLGGFVCVALAINHGDEFGPLLVANGGAAFSPERRLAFTKMADLVDDNGMEAIVDLAVHRIFTEPYLNANPDVIAERRAVLVEIDPVAFAASCRALRDMDLRPFLGGISNPTLCIAGGEDQTTPPEMAEELAAGIDGAELIELDDCGHCPQLEQPEAFVDGIEMFLERVQLTGGRS